MSSNEQERNEKMDTKNLKNERNDEDMKLKKNESEWKNG